MGSGAGWDSFLNPPPQVPLAVVTQDTEPNHCQVSVNAYTMHNHEQTNIDGYTEPRGTQKHVHRSSGFDPRMYPLKGIHHALVQRTEVVTLWTRKSFVIRNNFHAEKCAQKTEDEFNF